MIRLASSRLDYVNGDGEITHMEYIKGLKLNSTIAGDEAREGVQPI